MQLHRRPNSIACSSNNHQETTRTTTTTTTMMEEDQAVIQLDDCPYQALQQTLQHRSDPSIEQQDLHGISSNKSRHQTAVVPITTTAPRERTIKHASPGPISEFVQKLFRMLEESTSNQDTLCWGADGASFIVNDVDEFSRTMLPRHFKHGNFASFVRQLNKYGFHKVRHSDVHGRRMRATGRDQVCEFAHVNFRRDRKDLLGTIRRKTCSEKTKRRLMYATTATTSNPYPTRQQRQQQQQRSATTTGAGAAEDMDQDNHDHQQHCKKDVETLRDMVEKLNSRLDGLQESHNQMESNLAQHSERGAIVLKEFLELEKTMATQDSLIRQILKLVGNTNDQQDTTTPSLAGLLHNNVSVSLTTTHTLANAYNKVSQLGFDQLKSIVKHLGQSQCKDPASPSSVKSQPAVSAGCVVGEMTPETPETTQGSACVTPPGLVSPAQTCIDDNNTNDPMTSVPKDSPTTPPSPNVEWTVPPHVLLVDDDRVCRDLSGKLLQLVGCTIDLAKDGVEALHKLTVKKYDLVLMDIMMPNLDGISATRNIRQYDNFTPIVSMTSNFTDKDIMLYAGSGMTDILPKPFTADTLYSILERYCAHLKETEALCHQQQPLLDLSLSKDKSNQDLDTALSLLASMTHPDTGDTAPQADALYSENIVNVIDS